jgi:hypothetical protein
MALRRTTLIVALALLVFAPAASAATPTRHVTVAVTVKRFVTDGTRVTALGVATADVGVKRARRTVTLAVSKGSSCSILTLSLQNLHLQLLGLDLLASPINLRVTGKRTGTLGALFCRLATGLKLGKAASARAAAASLNRRLAHRPMHVLSARSTVSAQTAQAGATSCPVLDLVLGPLHLDLLGLVVDLYAANPTKPVEVTLTAVPTRGILGSTLCKLASPQPSG